METNVKIIIDMLDSDYEVFRTIQYICCGMAEICETADERQVWQDRYDFFDRRINETLRKIQSIKRAFWKFDCCE